MASNGGRKQAISVFSDSKQHAEALVRQSHVFLLGKEQVIEDRGNFDYDSSVLALIVPPKPRFKPARLFHEGL